MLESPGAQGAGVGVGANGGGAWPSEEEGDEGLLLAGLTLAPLLPACSGACQQVPHRLWVLVACALRASMPAIDERMPGIELPGSGGGAAATTATTVTALTAIRKLPRLKLPNLTGFEVLYALRHLSLHRPARKHLLESASGQVRLGMVARVDVHVYCTA